MLQNSGSYGPNDVPVNLGVPINRTQISGPMSISNRSCSTEDSPQQIPQPLNSYCDVPIYPPINHHPFGKGSPMSPFQNYQPTGFHNNFLHNNTNSSLENPLNNTPNVETISHSYYNLDSMSNNDLDYKNPVSAHISKESGKGLPINIPQFNPKTFQEHNMDIDHVDSYNNSHGDQGDGQNLDLSLKSQGKSELEKLDISKRRSIENTVRLIENILINTTSSRSNIINESPKKMNSQIDVRDSEDSSKEASEDEQLNYQESEGYNNKNVLNHNIENNVFFRSIVKKPQNPTILAKENLNTTEEHIYNPSVIIKVEAVNEEIDINFSNPFCRDVNGVSKESVDSDVIENKNSISEAKNALEKGLSTKCYFECPYCSLLLRNPKRFIIHTKWHSFGLTNDRRLELAKEKLLKRSVKAKDLEEQSQKEGNTGNFPCKDCNKIFDKSSSLKNHRYKFHPTPGRECRICKETIVGWTAMKTHLLTHNNEALYQCTDCPKKFKHSTSLAKHKDTHLEKVHPCPKCDKMFGSVKQVKIHSRSHERFSHGTTYSCSYCAKTFFSTYNLQVHERRHRNEKPFTCDICDTSYCTNSSLQRHYKASHSKLKPFVCTVCHRSFATEVIRDRHEIRSHGDPEQFKFPCKQCDCRYLTLKDLRKHMYKCHPKGKKGKRKPKTEDDSE